MGERETKRLGDKVKENKRHGDEETKTSRKKISNFQPVLLTSEL